MASLNTIKSWFKTGLRPTSAQFSAAWDSYFHKDDTIPVSNVENLDNRFGDKIDKEVFQYHEESPEAHIELFTGVQAAFTGVEQKFAGVQDEFTTVRSEFSNATSIGFKGLAAADTIPVVPVPETPVFYQATAGVTYSEFKDAAAVAITIPLKVSDKYVVNPRLISEGTSWKGAWELVDGVDPVDYLLKSEAVKSLPTANLIDKSKLESGNYSATTGVPQASNNWIRTPLLDISKHAELTLSGHGISTAIGARFVFFYANKSFLSSVTGAIQNTPITFVKPEGAFYIGIVIVNAVDVGLSPTDNQWADSVMLSAGTNVIYEPFSNSIAIESVKGLNAELGNRVSQAEFAGIKPLSAVILTSKQLIDKSKITAVIWAANGTFSASTNRIATDKIELPDNISSFILSGYGGLSGASVRAVFFNSTGIAMDSILAQGINEISDLTINKPTGAKYIAINLANVIDIGLNPTNNSISNAVMLRAASEPAGYEVFGKLIPKENIKGLVTISTKVDSLDSDVGSNKQNIDIVLNNDYNIYSKFDGTTSYIPLGQSLTLNSDGDYLEYEAKAGAGWLSYLDGLGMFGVAGSSANLFGIYDATTIYFRTISGSPYIIFTGLPNMLVDFHKIKLQVSNGGIQWDLYVDGVLNQSKPKDNPFIVSNIGGAYVGADAYADFHLKYASIKAGGTIVKIDNPSIYSGAVDVQQVVEKKPQSTSVTEISPVYVSYDPVGYLGRENISIFVRRGNSNRYIMHKIQHEYNMDEIIYTDLFRLRGADEYQFSNGVMAFLSANTIQGGESECVYQSTVGGKADFTGGYHGDEIFQSFELFIDGVKKDLSTAFTLIPAQSSHYTQRSTTHETANNIGGVATPVPGHPLDAIHYKKTVFEKSSYTTYNDLKWQREFPLFWYHGICCLGKTQASRVYDEEFETNIMTGGVETFYEKFGNNTMEYYNPDTGLSATVTATFDGIIADEQCVNFVWDRANDSKYYRNTTTYTSVIGRKEKSVMKVTYK